MRAVILNGAAGDDAAAGSVYQTLTDLLRQAGWTVDEFILQDMNIAPCLGCFGCWTKTPGVCVIDDAGREVAKAAARCDLEIFFTPVTFGGYSAALKKAVDRLIPNLLPFFLKYQGEVHHSLRYASPPRFVVIGTMPEAEAESEEIFRTLAGRNAINLHADNHAAGVAYTGAGPDTVREKLVSILREGGVGDV